MPSDTSSTSSKSSTSKLVKSKPVKAFFTALQYLLIIVLVYSAINWWRQPVMPANPELQLTDYQGQTVDIKTMSQQSPVLVYFWGSWCGVCSITTPKVNHLSNQGYPVVSIAVKSGNNSELNDYLQQKNIHFTTINDEDGKLFADWKGQVTPSFIILKDGEMSQGLTGVQPEWSLKLRLWLSDVF